VKKTTTTDVAMELLKRYRGYLIEVGRYEAWLICKQNGDVRSRQVRDRMSALGLLHPEIGEHWLGSIFHKSSCFEPTGKTYNPPQNASRNYHGGAVQRVWKLRDVNTFMEQPRWYGAPPPGIRARTIPAKANKTPEPTTEGQPGLFDKPTKEAPMAIKTFSAVRATAVVLGNEHQVEWEGSDMHIRNVTFAEFNLILQRIENVDSSSAPARTFLTGAPQGSVVARAQAAAASGSEPGHGARPTPLPRPVMYAKPGEFDDLRDKSPGRPPLEVFVAEAAKAMEPNTAPEANAQSPKPPAGSGPPVSREPGEDDVPVLSTEQVGIPDSVTKAGRMLDVVNWLIERGIKEPAAMVAECEKLKASVPFLARVNDMDKRIQRTLAAYHGG